MINLANREIGNGRVFIIAEIGSNHNQSIELAKELIDAAKECGADAVKFQSIKADEIYNIKLLSDDEKNLLESIQLKEDWYQEIFNYSHKIGMICLSAPTYLRSVDLLMQMNVKAIKIASPQTYGFPQLIDKVAATGLPTFMSTGYCTYADIENAVNRFTSRDKLVLMHCTSNYPTKVEDVNLKFLHTLKGMFGTYTGFSDHTLGINISVAAAAMGIDVLEKHMTFSRLSNGPDHFFALEIDEFKNMVNSIREVEVSCGKSYKDRITPFELEYRYKLLMRCHVNKTLKKGDEITLDDIIYLRGDCNAISGWDIQNYLGRRLIINKNYGEAIKENDFI